jgi:hypothetical protein
MLTKKNKPPKKITHLFVTHMPPKGALKDGIVYISLEYKTVLHKCACGCGSEISTPLTPRDWCLSYNGETISLEPSVGNWSYACRSHYIIRNGWIIWPDNWSDLKIKTARKAEQTNRSKLDDKKGNEWFA